MITFVCFYLPILLLHPRFKILSNSRMVLLKENKRAKKARANETEIRSQVLTPSRRQTNKATKADKASKMLKF